MTTLTKAIEAAREALDKSINFILKECNGNEAPRIIHSNVDALSTLPAKPMTEEEMKKYINNYIDGATFDYAVGETIDYTELTIHALSDAGVLYVDEK